MGKVVSPKEFWCNFTKNRIVNAEQLNLAGSFMVRFSNYENWGGGNV